MARSKPVSLTSVATNAYAGPDPQPLVVVGSLPVGSIPAATTAAIGGVKKLPAQVNSVATDAAGIVTDFNLLLGKLRTAGILS